jgi:site-specific DNA-cytosine methylase
MGITPSRELRSSTDQKKTHSLSELVCRRTSSLIASPGQSLPQFPRHTHGKPPLPPYVSLADAIDNIRPNDRLHDVRACTFPFPRYTTIEPYLPFPGTIMAANAEHVFPDGTRRFTLRELARIQTFSDAHLFGETRIQRQSISLPELTDFSWKCCSAAVSSANL